MKNIDIVVNSKNTYTVNGVEFNDLVEATKYLLLIKMTIIENCLKGFTDPITQESLAKDYCSLYGYKSLLRRYEPMTEILLNSSNEDFEDFIRFIKESRAFIRSK